jgi:formylglycine-generating enzyme required for sulfatase activity
LLPPEQVNPRISLGVADCIHQAMHPDPARRHKDAVHFKSALQTLPPIVSTLPLPQPAATQPSAPKALNFKTLRLKRFINWPIWARGVGIAGLFGLALLVIYTIRNIQPPSTPEQTSLAEVMTQTEMAAEAQPTITPMVPVLPVPTISPAPPLPSETFPATPTRTEAPTSRPTSLLTATSKPIVGLDSTQVSTTEVSATQISPKDNMVLVYIPAGAFEMGSEEGQSDENPVHTISLDAFWMDQHEVTLAQFKKFILEESYEANLCVGYDDHPVTCVIWYDALAYCDWAGRRLPTEAEWEKAARGGLTGARYPWGDEDPVCTSNAQNGAQYHECSDHAVSVMTFPPNGYGLYDMAGNVWEWVFDWYDSDYYGNSPTNNPQGPSSGNYRILRGGSWRNSGNLLRVAFRLDYNPVTSYNYIGFRCALSP